MAKITIPREVAKYLILVDDVCNSILLGELDDRYYPEISEIAEALYETVIRQLRDKSDYCCLYVSSEDIKKLKSILNKVKKCK